MGIRRWWRARSGRRLEDFDDDHTTATTGAWRAQIGRRRGVLYLGSCRHIEQFPGARDIVFAAGAGQEAVVADAVEALRQNVEQEAANEFVRTEGHGALAVGTVAAIVLVAERDPGLHCPQSGSSMATPLRANLSREEPDAGILHVRICEGWGCQ